jgi:hypothetical protein
MIVTMAECLDIVILESGATTHAVAFVRRGGDIAITTLPCDGRLATLEAFRDKIKNALEKKDSRPSSNDLEKYGQNLHRYCFDVLLRKIWDSLPPTNVPIQLISDHSQLRSLPWEYMLGDAAPGPSPNRSIARIVPTVGLDPGDPPSFGQKKPKVLFVASDPRDQEQVSWTEVQSALEASFARVQGTVEMRTIAGAGWKETVEAILEFGPEIFHFSGHGEVVNGKGRLLFTSRATQRSEPVPVKQFCNTLQQRGIRLVVLTACNTSSGDFKKDFAIIAESLVRSGIPAVVANQLPVPDETAASFVRALYLELVRSGNIDRAVAEGRVTLYGTINVEDDEVAALEWGIPTLHRHPNGAQIFKVSQP